MGNPLKYTDPTGHYATCDDGKCPDTPLKPRKTGNPAPTWTTYSGDDPYSVGYDPNSDSVPDWGKDQSEPWRQLRAGRVWNWVCTSSGWWQGCPSSQKSAAWLLWQEGGLLYNAAVVEANPWSKMLAARQAMVGWMAYLFGDGDISAADLSAFTSWFNPDSGGAFSRKDWAELMTSPPSPPDWFGEVDRYWAKGPYSDDNGRKVDHWWTSTEAAQCTLCTQAFSIIIPPIGTGEYKNGAIFYFEYLP